MALDVFLGREIAAIRHLLPQALRLIGKNARTADLIVEETADKQGIVTDHLCRQPEPRATSQKTIVRILFEQLSLTPGRREVGIAGRRPPLQPNIGKPATLKDSEKQLIHALLQDRGVGRNIEPFLTSEFLMNAWSYPVIAGLVQNPDGNVEDVVGALADPELQRQVRAAVFEPFGRITSEEALASIAQLYDAHLVKKEREIREQLKQYGSGAVPIELVRQQMEIAAEKSRIKSLKP